MLRVTLLCLAAAAAVVGGMEDVAVVDARALRQVKPDQPYRQNVKLVKQAADRTVENLVDVTPEVTEPSFHSAFVLGVVQKASQRLQNNNNGRPLLVANYLETLNKDLPYVYLQPGKSSQDLKANLRNVSQSLEDLLGLMNVICRDKDDKDCNKLVQYTLDTSGDTLLDKSRRRGAVVLKLASRTAQELLRLNEHLVLAANNKGGLGFTLKTNLLNLSYLAYYFAETLLEARAPLE